MGKKKKRSNLKRNQNQKVTNSNCIIEEQIGSTTNDDNISDYASISGYSLWSSSGCSSYINEDNEIDQQTTKLNNEEDLNVLDNDCDYKLGSILDKLLCTKMSAKNRLECWKSLIKIMSTRLCDEFLTNNKLTIMDIFERTFKRSQLEIESATVAMILTMITMADGDEHFCDEMFSNHYNILEQILMDHTMNPLVRSQCAIALSFGCFITDFGTEKIRDLLLKLVEIAFVSYSTKNNKHEQMLMYQLQEICIQMFTFLITIETNTFVETFFYIQNIFPKLDQCLQSSNLSLRIAAGQCVAIVIEKCSSIGDDHSIMGNLIDIIQSLAIDCKKWKSKKDLRQQRSVFRSILRTIQDDQFETVKVNIVVSRNVREQLNVNSWSEKLYYDVFCRVLGSGMNVHLGSNQFIREVFQLGPMINYNEMNDFVLDRRQVKVENDYQNNFNRKCREQYRTKKRHGKQSINNDYIDY